MNHQKVFKSFSILLAEDNALMSQEIAQILRIFFKEVFVASNGKEALAYYEDEKPDIILSDIQMPIMDGLTLVRTIRKSDFHTPIIFLTSFCDQETLLHAANSVIDGYILKPIALEPLLETLTNVLPKIQPKMELISLTQHLIYHTLSEELFHNGTLIALGSKEKMLLKLFLEAKEQTLKKEHIVLAIWGVEDVTDSALKNLLNRLRAKIGADMIVSVKGSGWRLKTCFG